MIVEEFLVPHTVLVLGLVPINLPDPAFIPVPGLS